MMKGLRELSDWLPAHPAVLWWGSALSLTMFCGTLLVIPLLLVKMPADYFTTPHGEPLDDWRDSHPVIRWSLRIAKNLLGVLLVVTGIVLLVLPGQGILTILLGVTLLDLPGKRRLEIALLRRQGVQRAVDWLRRKYDRPPLEVPPPPADG